MVVKTGFKFRFAASIVRFGRIVQILNPLFFKSSIPISTFQILPNRTMNAAKRNLNPVFTTIARLSKTSKKDIPPSYRKPSGKP